MTGKIASTPIMAALVAAHGRRRSQSLCLTAFPAFKLTKLALRRTHTAGTALRTITTASSAAIAIEQ
ncbi:hypothetical protein FGO68_gene9323 [Halteria grandinella]|uniref:Uncharacterized protein n=1 Tax=Halteria grandinella TaxID=5974 RepID=A0A8J8NCQ9_HALGN|nr:hypothetical protein FGO68_gene9323 [Halteria grandinella]